MVYLKQLMKKKVKDMDFFDLIEEITQTNVARIVDPSQLDYDERHLFIDTIYVDYLYHKDRKNIFLQKQFARLLSSLIKKYGH